MGVVDCAVVLAGGKGTRLFPLTLHRPKPLVPVALTPMIDFALNQVKNAGIKKVIIAVRYLGEQIIDYVQSHPHYEDLDIIIPKMDPIGTADAVRLAKDHIEGDFVVTMADIVTDFQLEKMINFFSKTGAYATISLKNIDFPTKKFGVILLDEEQNIEMFLEKPLPSDLLFSTIPFAYRHVSAFHQNLVNTGMYVFKHKILEILEEYRDIIDFGQHVFPYLLQARFKLNGFVDEYYWMDCGNLQNYLWANYDLMRGFMKTFKIQGKRINSSWIGNNVKIDPTVKIKENVIIGDNVSIGKNTVIGPNVVIHSNCTVGENVEISESVIWEEVIINDKAKINLSAIADHCVIKEGITVSNYSAIGKGQKIEKNVISTTIP